MTAGPYVCFISGDLHNQCKRYCMIIHRNNLSFLILSNFILRLWVSRTIWSDVFWYGCHMVAVCGWVQTAEDTVSFTAQVCCAVTLEKKARTCLKLADRHENLTQTHIIYGSVCLYIAVSILSWLSAHSGSAGSISELILDWNSYLILNWVWPNGVFACVCGFRE